MAAFPARSWDAFQEHWAKILGDQSVTTMAILFGGRVAGNIVCWEREHKRLVGYWIGQGYWGKGVASKALSEFLAVVKDRPLFAHVAQKNVPSIRVLEKCGFKRVCAGAMASEEVPSDGIEEFLYALDTNENRAAT